MKYYFLALKNYFEVDGRTTRKEFWMFFLINFLISLILQIIDGVLGFLYSPIPEVRIGILSGIYALFLVIPHFSIYTRRLHDIGKGWEWVLIGMIPVIGWIVLIYFFVQPSQPGSNKYNLEPEITP